MSMVGCSQMKWQSGDEKTARWAATVGCWLTGTVSSPAGCALDNLVGRLESVSTVSLGVTESGEEVGGR